MRPIESSNFFTVKLLVEATVPIKVAKGHIQLFIRCGTDHFHWSKRYMEMFEKLTKKDDSPMPKIWMDPEGKTRTYMFIDQKNETEKEHPDFNSVYTLTCPQAPDGKHIYSVKIKSVEYFEEAAVSNFKKYLVPTLIGITSAVATAAAGVFLKKYYFS